MTSALEMPMNILDEHPLFICRYQPIYYVLLLFTIAAIFSLSMNSNMEFSSVKHLNDLLQFFINQNAYGWFFFIFILIALIFFINAKLMITSNQIYVKSFGFCIRHIANKELIQHIRLYASFASRINVLRPISKKRLNFNEKLKLSSIGFCLLPEYRDLELMKQLDLKQFTEQDRIKIIQVLEEYWGLNPQKFLGREELLRLKTQHRLR